MAQKSPIHVTKIGHLPIERLTAAKVKMTQLDTMEIVAKASQNHFLDGFRLGGTMTDASKSGWAKRKGNVDPSRGILVGPGTGHLRRDINVLSVTIDTIVIGTKHIAYAAVHNEGLRIPRRGFTMTKREFIGPTKALEVANTQVIKVEMGKLFRPTG